VLDQNLQRQISVEIFQVETVLPVILLENCPTFIFICVYLVAAVGSLVRCGFLALTRILVAIINTKVI